MSVLPQKDLQFVANYRVAIMVYKYKRKLPKKVPVSQALIDEAIRKVRNNELSIRKAAKELNMAESSLRDKMKVKRTKRSGGQTTLTRDAEEELAHLLIVKAKWGFAAGREELKDIVQQYVIANKDHDTEVGRQLKKLCRFKVS